MLLKVNQKLIFPFFCINILPLRAISSLSIDYDLWYSATSIRISIWKMYSWGPRFILWSTCPSVMETCKIKQQCMTRKCDGKFFFHYFWNFFPLSAMHSWHTSTSSSKFWLRQPESLRLTGFHEFQFIFFPINQLNFIHQQPK